MSVTFQVSTLQHNPEPVLMLYVGIISQTLTFTWMGILAM